ncbi:3-phenylpropionate/cinnamic acid dioxygenase small subunit [Lipingzhangella halophila]|uniref:3-phenylpropionate/cinnamic acid dioxygenase small subunit n=1 Tax=Lipingzhangella halophila TaxID=1783352 RepID=A0A7W7W2X1_9ACTN|nr:3-phenylpropionate/cinnamic acid dioxygenase subunit beta [Lipingzhangella halophila]MBB4931140.1 3-phenylpropionate/cinnamic acid dioxygenase small subunit [Lipingzhangella halophila]
MASEKPDRDTVLDVTDFLYREALALDERRYRDWLDHLADDARYVVPLRVTREGQADWEVSPTSRIFDDDKRTLTLRVERLETDFAWAEQPPSRTRHYVTNIVADPGERADELLVSSNCLIYRSRGDSIEPNFYSIARKDTIRRVDGGLLLARRYAVIDQSVINGHNLSILL